MNETIFDKILDGSIPSHVVLENEYVFAFLDINPLSFGHTLVIPKERAAKLHELSEKSAAAIGRVLPRIARAIVEVTGNSDYNILQNNGRLAHQAVFHVHFHIIPKQQDGKGLSIDWKSQVLEDGPELAAAIREKLNDSSS